MKKNMNPIRFRHSVVALAVAAAFGPAFAADEGIAALVTPESSVNAGVASASGSKADRAFFGQYNGFRQNSGQLLFDVNLNKREEQTATWTTLEGRNLGNENREIKFGQQRQGAWKYYVEYGELVRNYSNTINSNITGVGTANVTVTALGNPTVSAGAAALAAAQGTGNNIDLKTTRKSLGLGGEMWLNPNMMVEATFKNEEKTGARIFARVATCSATTYGCNATFGALLMLPEPISSSTKQIELKLNFADEKLSLNGGYYGSFFVSNFGSLNPTLADATNLWNPNGARLNASNAATGNVTGILQSPIALPPDNQAHQLSLAGTYAFSKTTRATFRYAYTHGTQKERFDAMGLVGGPRGALDGVIDTTVAQFGISSKPMPKLTLVADLRYEQKSDKTPIDRYRGSVTTGNPVGLTNTNSQGSHTKIKGKLEANYQLPDGYRAGVGIDYDFRDVGRPTGTNDTSGQAAAIRAKNDEIGYRLDLRKSMSETLNGAISVSHSTRNGSRWMRATNGTAPTEADGTLQGTGAGLFSLFWADLSRDKIKGSIDWAATDNLSFQASADVSTEHYFAPSNRGARDGKTTNLNLDVAYRVSDAWKVNGWYSRGDTILDINGSSGAYMAGLRQLGHNLGLGVRGNPSGKLEVGADFTFSYEVNRTAVGVWGAASAQPNALPTAAFRQTNLNIFGKYAVDKQSDIKVNLVHQRYYSNEWYWNTNGTSFFFSDGSTVTQKDQQNVTFIGASYVYKWQ